MAFASTLRAQGSRLAADLFSGAGGLSLGLEKAGYRVVLSIDHDPNAVETHRHHFGGLSLGWDLADADHIREVGELVRSAQIELLAGGPPCQPFSKAGRYMIRHRVRHGLRDPYDERRDLWRSFLEVVDIARPPAVLMENVPDMALDREMFILRTIVEELELMGYSVEERVVDTWRYGVPQFRQRLILVALRDGLAFTWPPSSEDQVNVWNAIGDLPEVEGGWRPAAGADGWTEYGAPTTAFQRRMRDGVPKADTHKVFDHITRPVRDDDKAAFDVMTSKTRYSEIPEGSKRYREDIFQDKYKRLDETNLSRTITAHIAKDGYWYIHPRQSRTLTIREAARLQSFPDWYRFAGPPSAAFRQIGNAVPPLLAEHLGAAIAESLDLGDSERVATREVALTLAEWYVDKPARAIPWLDAKTRWQALCAEMLLDRADTEQIRHLWGVINLMESPENSGSAELEEPLFDMAKAIGRDKRGTQILELADYLREHPGTLESDDLTAAALPSAGEAVTDLIVLVVPSTDEEESEEPVLVTKGVLRVAARFHALDVDKRNRLTDGRLAIARMVGGGSNARMAHKGLIELANSYCRPVDPVCSACPLEKHCAKYEIHDTGADPLF